MQVEDGDKLKQFVEKQDFSLEIELVNQILENVEDYLGGYVKEVMKLENVIKQFLNETAKQYSKEYEQFNVNNHIEEVVFDQGTMQDLGMDIEDIDEEQFEIVKMVMDKRKWQEIHGEYRLYERISKELKMHFLIAYRVLIGVQDKLAQLQVDYDILKIRYDKLQAYSEKMKEELNLIRKENSELTKDNKRAQDYMNECMELLQPQIRKSSCSMGVTIKNLTDEDVYKSKMSELKIYIEEIISYNSNIIIQINEQKVINDEVAKKYRDVLVNYNSKIEENESLSKQLIEIQYLYRELQEAPVIVETVKEVTIIEDMRFKKEHDQYHNDDLYRLVIQTVLDCDNGKKLHRQEAVARLNKNEMVQDFLANTKRFKLTTSSLINLYDKAIQIVGDEYGLTIEDIRENKTRKRLGLETKFTRNK